MTERKVRALRGTGDEGVQWVDVYYRETCSGEIEVTGIGRDISPFRSVSENLRKNYVGKRFMGRQELNRSLNGEYVIG